MAAAERLSYHDRRVRGGNIIYGNVADASVSQPAGQNIGRILCISID